MQIEMNGNTDQADEIRQLIEEWDAALQSEDVDRLVSEYSEDAEVFDIGSQFHGKSQYRAQWISCFPYFGGSIRLERRKVKIFADGNLAFVNCYTRISGANTPAHEKQPWCRTTVCLQKREGEWQVVHEHISMPIDFEAGAPALIVGEP